MPEKITLRPEDIADFWPTEKQVSVEVTAEQALAYNDGDESARAEVLSQLVELHIFRKTAQNPRGVLVHQNPLPMSEEELMDMMRGMPPVSGAYIVQVKAIRGGKFLGQCTHYIDAGDMPAAPVPAAPQGYPMQYQPSPTDSKIDKLIEVMALQLAAQQAAPKTNDTLEIIKALGGMRPASDTGKEVASAVSSVITAVMTSKAKLEEITTQGQLDMAKADQAHNHSMALQKVAADKEALLERIRLANEAQEASTTKSGMEPEEYLTWDDGTNLKKLAEIVQEVLPVSKDGTGLGHMFTDMVLPIVSELNDYLNRRDLLVITKQQLINFQQSVFAQGHTQGMEKGIQARTTGAPPVPPPAGPVEIKVDPPVPPVQSPAAPQPPQPPAPGADATGFGT